MSIVSAPDQSPASHEDDFVSVAMSESQLAPRRKPKFTEKGKAFLKTVREKHRERTFRSLMLKTNDVVKLGKDPNVTLSNLESGRDQIDQLKEQFDEAHRTYHDLLETTSEEEESYRWFDVRDREFNKCRLRICERIQSCERDSARSASSEASKERRSHMSKTSRRSSLDSVSMAKADAAAKAAKTKIEMEFLDRENDREDELRRRENELRRLRLEKQYALAKAEERAFEEVLIEESSRDKPNEDIKPKTTTTMKTDESRTAVKQEMDPESPPFIPCVVPNVNQQPVHSLGNIEQVSSINFTLGQLVDLQARQTELSSMFVNQQRSLHLPAKEPPTFSGDSAFEYPAFKTAFDCIIAANVPTDSDKLFFLEKYTTGKANDVIKGFLATGSGTAYHEARKLLDQRFGNPVTVAEDYKRKLRSWKQVSDGDSKGLQEFSDFLVRCEEAMKTMKSMAKLDSTQLLQSISTKLPSYMGVKWCRSAHEAQVKRMRTVAFRDLVQFVKEESELANDPIFSPDAFRREKRMSVPYKDSGKGSKLKYPSQSKVDSSRTFATSTTSVKQSEKQKPVPAQNQKRLCPVCSGEHIIMKCDKLIKANPDERFDIIKSKRLCFKCFKANHISTDCTSKTTCSECGKRHNTLLHGTTPRPKLSSEQASSAGDSAQPSRSSSNAMLAQSNAASIAHSFASGTRATTTCRIVPVILYHKDDPSIEVKTYALLDDASDTTFVTNKVKQELNIEGVSTNLNLNTMHGQKVIPVTRIDGLIVERPDRRAKVELPKAYAKDVIPARKDQIPTPEIAEKWQHLKRIKDKVLPLDQSLDVSVLIGANCPKAIKPREVITGRSKDPYAVRTLLGWCIVGPVDPAVTALDEDSLSTCNRVIAHEVMCKDEDGGLKFVMSEPTKELVNPVTIARMFEQDFTEQRGTYDKGPSREDRQFLTIVKQGIHKTEDGHYELPLPLRDDHVSLPNNREVALCRLRHLKKRLESDERLCNDYVKFMNGIIDDGYAEVVPVCEKTDVVKDKAQPSLNTWYIPHHGIYHPKKEKFRVVFDCAAIYRGQSLNENLIQGPDLTNNLVGVLIRFRQEQVAFSCDIEGMFHQVKVNPEHRDLLRFLWWPNGDIRQEPKEYRMTVHLFGATSSPSCANFALKSTADDSEAEFGSAAASFLKNDFYVDDGLKSVPTTDEAVSLIGSVKQMCSRGGFNLHKFVSNDKEVIKSIPDADKADNVKEMDMDLDSLPLERTLGIQWCIESDCFQFTIVLQNKPCTRRGILSTVSSIFDPLGFVAPLLLEGKSILQELCRQDLGWDDPIPDDIKIRWERWKGELTQLRCVSIPRCYKPEGFGRVIRTELHHFSDASVRGYGQCSYLRMMDEDGQIHCTFVMGKSRVTPLKPVTIPRLELTAAVCSARISQQILRELEYKIDENYYWTDSKVVLGYISNESRRFHVFVSNRVQEIQEITCSSQWRYVESKDNPADEASRGMKARDLHDSRWILGPEFLWHSDDVWPDDEMQDFKIGSQSDDPEVKKSVVMATRVEPVQQSDIDIRVQRFSSWSQAKRAVALARKYVQVLRDRAHKKPSREIPVNVDDLEVASKQIIRAVQARAFEDELQTLKPESLLDEVSRLKPLKMNSSIAKLDPFIDKDGIVRVGGRLHQANLSNDIKHPILLPKKSHVTTLIVRHFHERASHQGRSITLGEIRSSGFWIIGGSSLVSGVIASCTKCRKLRGSVTEQKMCDLPEDRLEPCPPFTYCAVDYFGPFIIKERRSELKRYGVLFTCMSSRAIHLETSVSLETDSFLNALRRFLSRRGPVRQLRSDQGTNFVGARRELKEALSEMDSSRVKNELLKEQCDWIDFKMNVPGASHMGGVWERQIRTVRAVLSSLLLSNGSQLDDESLRTLMCEAESIVNSRPLIPNQLTDSGSLQPLTPNSLLTMKSKVLLPPPGKFEPADVFSRKRWRRVQHLANEFWSRWRKEFVLGLQERQKWTRVRQNLGIGDVVMVMDANIPRNSWQLARVTSVYPSSDGQVRKVQVILADHCLDARGRRTGPLRFLDRPVQKLVLVLPSCE